MFSMSAEAPRPRYGASFCNFLGSSAKVFDATLKKVLGEDDVASNMACLRFSIQEHVVKRSGRASEVRNGEWRKVGHARRSKPR